MQDDNKRKQQDMGEISDLENLLGNDPSFEDMYPEYKVEKPKSRVQEVKDKVDDMFNEKVDTAKAGNALKDYASKGYEAFQNLPPTAKYAVAGGAAGLLLLPLSVLSPLVGAAAGAGTYKILKKIKE